MVGTIYCHHHEEAEVYGTEPVPCPFCGLGAVEDPMVGPELEEEDSNDALRHALFDDPSGKGSELTVHW